MKKKIILLLLAIMLLVLSACGSAGNKGEHSNIYDVEHNGKVFTVDQEKQTITVDGYICRYDLHDGGNNVNLKVTYPDSSTYSWSLDVNSGRGSGTWSDNYVLNRYVGADVLLDVLRLDRRAGSHGAGPYLGLGILLIVLGGVGAAAPRALWYIGYGWRYKDVEPSNMALLVNRVSGIIGIVLGIICLAVFVGLIV